MATSVPGLVEFGKKIGTNRLTRFQGFGELMVEEFGVLFVGVP